MCGDVDMKRLTQHTPSHLERWGNGVARCLSGTEDGWIPYPPILPTIVYSSLARQVIDDYGIMKGICLDVGSGVGILGIELAKRTCLEVCLIDIDEESLRGALCNSKHFKVTHRVITIRADVHHLPLKEGSANLIVSRGSALFWKDPPKAFSEIYRVLAPFGVALIGGGLHRYLPQDERPRIMEKIKAHFQSSRAKGLLPAIQWPLDRWLAEAGIKTFKVITEDFGKWVEIRKRV